MEKFELLTTWSAIERNIIDAHVRPTAFFPAARSACAPFVLCTDVFFFAAGPACALSVPCTGVLSLVAVFVPYTDP
ncbi:hypothetical protein PC119_g26965 [Phytophthora cactorum]|uniref:Uncharacterized protein n=1 Tax=Phytophthora cactorum TaxID=29920 RepID=A0A8T1A968_9STRA|nr:hypothetical protein PC112_g24311 [Phytophthora cactorum]KAG2807042.1 hypothetical protein PC113_g24079 [Phytophthora cactorum]KAG2871514.1 hypothetical protein PC114_g26877 [Phytophthora cactorum]KAG2874424.1 hypothetical protein PC115_g24153 [Phytophthora cactorum]KAG2881935.1 hypothetical protein PC117_g26309 [Phytophthora cactorum]